MKHARHTSTTAAKRCCARFDRCAARRRWIRAIEQGTSVSAKVLEFLQQYVDEADPALRAQRETATDRLMAAIEIATAQARPDAPSAGKAKRRGLREQIYEADFRARSRAAGTPGRPK